MLANILREVLNARLDRVEGMEVLSPFVRICSPRGWIRSVVKVKERKLPEVRWVQRLSIYHWDDKSPRWMLPSRRPGRVEATPSTSLGRVISNVLFAPSQLAPSDYFVAVQLLPLLLNIPRLINVTVHINPAVDSEEQAIRLCLQHDLAVSWEPQRHFSKDFNCYRK